MANKQKQPQEPDVSRDPGFGWRFLKMLAEQVGAIAGEHGLDIGFVSKGLALVESVVGPALTAQGLNALGALVENPESVKRVIRLVGLPEQINPLIDETIDSSFAALRKEYLVRDRLTNTQVTTALGVAGAQLRSRLQAIATYAEAKVLLGEPDQKALDDIVTRIRRLTAPTTPPALPTTPPTTPPAAPNIGEKAWAYYRGLLTKPALLRSLARQQGHDAAVILEWLKGEHGSAPVASQETQELKATLAKAGKTATAWVAGEVSGFIKDPGAAFLPYMRHATTELGEEQDKLVAARARLVVQRQRRPNVAIGVWLFIGVAIIIVVCIAVVILRSMFPAAILLRPMFA